MQDYVDLQNRMAEVSVKSALELEENGEISKETSIELNEITSSTITFVLSWDKELRILKENEINTIKHTRRALLEDPSNIDTIPCKEETSRILTMFLLAVSFLNQEREVDELHDELLDSIRKEEEEDGQ